MGFARERSFGHLQSVCGRQRPNCFGFAFCRVAVACALDRESHLAGYCRGQVVSRLPFGLPDIRSDRSAAARDSDGDLGRVAAAKSPRSGRGRKTPRLKVCSRTKLERLLLRYAVNSAAASKQRSRIHQNNFATWVNLFEDAPGDLIVLVGERAQDHRTIADVVVDV